VNFHLISLVVASLIFVDLFLIFLSFVAVNLKFLEPDVLRAFLSLELVAFLELLRVFLELVVFVKLLCAFLELAYVLAMFFWLVLVALQLILPWHLNAIWISSLSTLSWVFCCD
jgi:hypothetical protein